MGIVFGRITVETPKYDVVKTLPDNIEVRKYAPVVAATVTMKESTRDAEGNAFRSLARYIGVFGSPQNEKSSEIAMTAPVVTSTKKSEEIAMTAPVNTQGQDMSFLLPSKYTLETAPKPIDPDVRLHELPTRYEAVMVFSGTATSKYAEEMATKLRSVLEKKGEEHGIRIKGDWYLARYNPPFSLPMFKTNEIHFPVQV
mmetsp:Transcript_4852/g.8924  ORF Transcript_4852/g.8924 Transcript_4852/m.8924 type:complete len:199 (+) Transcript_4852:1-597(+)